MDIRVLKYFVQVAKSRNFTRAAEQLYISQPALSKMIKKLEAELGVSLFDVRPSGVNLTDYGRELYRRALPLIAEFDSLTNFVEELQTTPTGKLRVGVTPMIATLFMVDIVTEFSRVWPEIELQIVEDGSIALRRSLLEGELQAEGRKDLEKALEFTAVHAFLLGVRTGAGLSPLLPRT